MTSHGSINSGHSAIFQMVTRPFSEKNVYANELICYHNLNYNHIPRAGDFISHIIIKTDKPLPNQILLTDGYNKQYNCIIQKINDGWYRFILPQLLHSAFYGIDIHYILPQPNIVYANNIFVNIEHRNNSEWTPIMPPHPEICHVSRLKDWPGHLNITHISFQGIPLDQKIEIIMHSVKIFVISDINYRIALEIICGGKSIYFVGTGFRMPRIDSVGNNINGVQKDISNSIQARL